MNTKTIKKYSKFALLASNIGLAAWCLLMFLLMQTQGYALFYEHVDAIRYCEIAFVIVILCSNVYVVAKAILKGSV